MKRFIPIFAFALVLLFALPVWAGIRGDVDGSGVVDIDDVNNLINVMLGKSQNPEADVNGDGMADIDDLNIVINVMLGKEPADEVETKIFVVNGVSFKMILIEDGTFTMGATAEQGGDFTNHERPVHEVSLSSYRIGETEVTQELWQAVMESNPSSFNGNPQLPVENVSYDDCLAFIAELNRLTGETFRLPTEAEWEYAARGGKLSKGYKYSGSNDIGDVCWFYDNTCAFGDGSPEYGTHSVGAKSPNELGLYDMSGNVMEWCYDWYGRAYYNNSPSTNPDGPATGVARVARGGSWYGGAKTCRVSHRDAIQPSIAHEGLGLRLAQ